MNYYLAATFADKLRAREYANDLYWEWDGDHLCIATWVFNDVDNEGMPADGSMPLNVMDYVNTDLEDVRRSDAVVLMVGERSSPGKVFEAAYAVSLGIPVYPVGARPADSIFNALYEPQVSEGHFMCAPFPRYDENRWRRRS